MVELSDLHGLAAGEGRANSATDDWLGAGSGVCTYVLRLANSQQAQVLHLGLWLVSW